MTQSKLPVRGICRCGQIEIRVSKPPMITSACHCLGCQTMSASAFSLTATIPSDGFEVTKGQPVIGGLHGEWAHHYHCAHCKSWMFTKAEGLDWFVNVRPTMLEEHADFVPFIETYTSEKLPWANTPAKRSYTELPPMEEYEKLTAEYGLLNSSPNHEANYGRGGKTELLK